MTGEDLRALRERLGRSLTELAEETGKDVSTICKYQNGSRPIPVTFERLVLKLRARRSRD